MDQDQQGVASPASNSMDDFNNDRGNNQPERWQPIHVSGANETMVQNPSPRGFNSTGREHLFHVPDAYRNINILFNQQMMTNPHPRMAFPMYPNFQIYSKMIAANLCALQNRQYRGRLPIPVVQNVRHITPIPGAGYVQIQQEPLTSQQSLLGSWIINEQGRQPWLRDPNLPYDYIIPSNSNVYHSTNVPRFSNFRLNQGNMYQSQERGNPANLTHYNSVRYPVVTVNNSNTINENQVQFLNNFMQYNRPINNIANINDMNENNVSQGTSSFVPPGQYNSNSSSRLNINENTNNEVMEMPNENETIPNSPTDVTTNNVRPAVPQNMNTLVTENKECEKSTYQGEYIKFLRKRGYNV